MDGNLQNTLQSKREHSPPPPQSRVRRSRHETPRTRPTRLRETPFRQGPQSSTENMHASIVSQETQNPPHYKIILGRALILHVQHVNRLLHKT